MFLWIAFLLILLYLDLQAFFGIVFLLSKAKERQIYLIIVQKKN
jgi:hypothetical protein